MDYCDYCYGIFITDVIVDFKGEVVHVDEPEVPGVKLLMGTECSISGHCRKLVDIIDLKNHLPEYWVYNIDKLDHSEKI